MNLQVNVLIVAGYADVAGTPIGKIEENYEQFVTAMTPLLDAVSTFDVEKMRDAVEKAAPVIKLTQERLVQAIPNIARGAEISRKIIKVADLLMLALSGYQVLKGGGIGGPRGPSSFAGVRVYAGAPPR